MESTLNMPLASGALSKVALPEHWLDDPDAEVQLPRGAEALVSGG